MRVELLKDKTVFTSQKKPEQTFAHFVEYAQRTDFRDRMQDIISSEDNYISEGACGRVYSIPDNDDFVLKVIKKSSIDFSSDSGLELREVKDPFGTINVGQPVAKYGDNIFVLIRQSGKEFGISYGKKGVVSLSSAFRYITNIRQMASIDQQAYNAFTDEIKQLRKLGFHMDIWNTNNILIDGNQINLVDIMKFTGLKQRFYARMSKIALVRLLIDETYLRRLLPYLSKKTKKQIGKNIEIISQKVDIAMKQSKLPRRVLLNKFLADFRDIIMTRKEPRIDYIINGLIKFSKR